MKDYKEQAKKHKLHVPPIFWKLSNEELNKYGCGPGEGIGDKIIPDTMYLLDVKVCCIVHDIDWEAATSMHDIMRANERFLINLIRLINGESSFGMKVLRRYRAITYYDAVQDIGAKFLTKFGNKK